MEGGSFFVAKYHDLRVKELQGGQKKEGEGGGNQLILAMPVFRVFCFSNGFHYSLTERMCSSKFGPYSHNNEVDWQG